MNSPHFPRLVLLLAAASLLGTVLVGCGPTAEEKEAAGRMEKAMDTQRDAMKNPAAPATPNNSR